MRENFVDRDTTSLIDLKQRLFFAGEIGCKGHIVIEVTKELEYLDPPGVTDPLVQTRWYSYNVSVQGVGNVFRYDNQHVHPGHGDAHHKHLFDWRSNNELPESPIWIGAENWPVLGQVIEEARQWHAEHYADLPDPEGYPAHLREGLRA